MPAKDAQLLKVERLGKQFGGVRALEGYNLALNEGELMGLIGPNGAGKTTALSTICELTRSRQGSILFRPDLNSIQHDITRVPAEEIVSMGISRIWTPM